MTLINGNTICVFTYSVFVPCGVSGNQWATSRRVHRSDNTRLVRIGTEVKEESIKCVPAAARGKIQGNGVGSP